MFVLSWRQTMDITNNIIINIIIVVQINIINAQIFIIMAIFIIIVITIAFNGPSINVFCQRSFSQFGLGK